MIARYGNTARSTRAPQAVARTLSGLMCLSGCVLFLPSRDYGSVRDIVNQAVELEIYKFDPTETDPPGNLVSRCSASVFVNALKNADWMAEETRYSRDGSCHFTRFLVFRNSDGDEIGVRPVVLSRYPYQIFFLDRLINDFDEDAGEGVFIFPKRVPEEVLELFKGKHCND